MITETEEPSAKKRVIVIGGGIAGLTAAYYLKKHGVSVAVFERGSAVGGCMRTSLKEEKYLVELGPNSFLSTAAPLIRLVRELSIEGQMVSSQVPSKNRYVLHKGRLERVPTKPHEVLSTHLLSPSGKLRGLSEMMIRSRSEPEESVAAFARRRFGEEVVANLVDPFVSGVYAGDADQLEVRSVFPNLVELEEQYGSVLKGMLHAKRGKKGHDLFSFRWGMGTLPARLEEVLRRDLHLNVTVESVERLRNGELSVRVEAPRRTFEADAVVIATPAWMTARIVASLAPAAIAPLMAIPFAPLSVVHTAFSKEAVQRKLDGFGFLAPRSEGVRMLGSIWASALFPGRCPENEVLLTNYIGGATDTRANDLEDYELLSYVKSGLETALNLKAEPTFAFIKRWQHAIPQYTIGHQERLAEIREYLGKVRDLFLVGNAFGGISVSDTVEQARLTADRVLSHLGVWSPTDTAGASRMRKQ